MPTNLGFLPFTKSSWKIQVESKWNKTFQVVLVENFPEQRNMRKVHPVFPLRIFQTECFIFLKRSLIQVSDFRGCFSVNATD